MSRDKGIAEDFYETSDFQLICRKCGGSNHNGEVYESVGDDFIWCIKCAEMEEAEDEDR
jgi:hypothetical protein